MANEFIPEDIKNAIREALSDCGDAVTDFLATRERREIAEAAMETFMADRRERASDAAAAKAEWSRADALFQALPSEEHHARREAAQVRVDIATAKIPRLLSAESMAPRVKVSAELENARSAAGRATKTVVHALFERYDGPVFQLVGDEQLVTPVSRGFVSNVPPPDPSRMQRAATSDGFAVQIGELPSITMAELAEILQPANEAAEAAE